MTNEYREPAPYDKVLVHIPCSTCQTGTDDPGHSRFCSGWEDFPLSRAEAEYCGYDYQEWDSEFPMFQDDAERDRYIADGIRFSTIPQFEPLKSWGYEA